MKKDGFNWYLRAGILLTGITLGVNRFVELPHFLYGLGLGLGIALELAGAFAASSNMKKIREFKRRILHALVK